MPEDDRSTTRLDAPISGASGGQLARDLRHYDSRLAIKEVVVEHVASTDFADRVKKIQDESLKSTETYSKFSGQVQTQIDSTLSDRNLKNKNFWWPIVISAIAAIAAVASVLIAAFKP